MTDYQRKPFKIDKSPRLLELESLITMDLRDINGNFKHIINKRIRLDVRLGYFVLSTPLKMTILGLNAFSYGILYFGEYVQSLPDRIQRY